MLWYRADTGLSRNRKTRRLSALLEMSIRDTVGLIHMFFADVAEQFEYGVITDMRESDVRHACEYKGHEELIKCLTESGFIDDDNGTLRVHDWLEYNGKLLRDRERKRKAVGDSADVPRKGSGESALPTDVPTDDTNVPTHQPTYEVAQKTWNDLVEGLGTGKKFQKWSDKRRKSYRARIKAFPDFWEAVERELPQMGKERRGSEWFGLHWLIMSDDNFLKFSEGNYRGEFGQAGTGKGGHAGGLRGFGQTFEAAGEDDE